MLSAEVVAAEKVKLDAADEDSTRIYRKKQQRLLKAGKIEKIKVKTKQLSATDRITSKKYEAEKNRLLKTVEEELAKMKSMQCSRLQLMLSAAQLISERYPIPGNPAAYAGYLFTKDEYAPVTDESPMFSIDCEWCLCVDGKPSPSMR